MSDVVDVKSAEVRPAPDLGSRAATEYIRGLVPVAERMVVLLDIDRLIGSDMLQARLDGCCRRSSPTRPDVNSNPMQGLL